MIDKKLFMGNSRAYYLSNNDNLNTYITTFIYIKKENKVEIINKK